MQLLDKYLSDVEAHLRTLPPNIRAGEINEMAGHLQQLRADFVASGRTIEEAEALAMGRFGTARKAGLRLRDVWEGNRGAWMVFFVVLLSNCVLQPLNFVACLLFFFNVVLRSPNLVEPLTPLLAFGIWWTILLLPFGLNFLLGRWGGRRVALAIPLLLLLLSPTTLRAESTVFSISVLDFKLSFASFLLLLVLSSACGAWSGSALKRRSRFALVGGASLEEASARLRERQKSHLRRVLLHASTCTAALAMIGALSFVIFRARVDEVLHPATPEAAVRVLLANPGLAPGHMHPSTNISIRLLPATPAEIDRNERRVAYTATMHAGASFLQSRTVYVKKQLQRALASKGVYSVEEYRDTLARLKPEGYTLRRVARVKKTAQGWQVDTSGDLYNQPHAWLYADYSNDYPFQLNR